MDKGHLSNQDDVSTDLGLQLETCRSSIAQDKPVNLSVWRRYIDHKDTITMLLLETRNPLIMIPNDIIK